MKKNIKLIPFISLPLCIPATIFSVYNLYRKIDHMFLILAVFMILICILLVLRAFDVLKKSNTEMESFSSKAENQNRNRITVFRDPQTGYSDFRPKLYRNFRISRYFWNRENMNRLIPRSEI